VSIFVDASALIAMLAAEPEGAAMADCLQGDPARCYSAISAWETVAGLCRSYRFAVPTARERVGLFLAIFDFVLIPIGQVEADLAADAYERFGRGRHRAALNMGDCFAYACARATGSRLLFTGDDFTKTDIEPALVWRQ
jgi:ribonuclease VapC